MAERLGYHTAEDQFLFIDVMVALDEVYLEYMQGIAKRRREAREAKQRAKRAANRGRRR